MIRTTIQIYVLFVCYLGISVRRRALLEEASFFYCFETARDPTEIMARLDIFVK
jgi:hypothetical protein